jgi:hypothetical protein
VRLAGYAEDRVLGGSFRSWNVESRVVAWDSGVAGWFGFGYSWSTMEGGD